MNKFFFTLSSLIIVVLSVVNIPDIYAQQATPVVTTYTTTTNNTFLKDTSLQRNNISVNKNTESAADQSRPMPDGYPVFVETGNIIADIERYTLKKNEWIAKHPAEYKALTSQESVAPKVQEISSEEFSKMTPEKQAVIKSNPGQYKIINK